MPSLPQWLQSQQSARKADEDRAARRNAYDNWARQYADSGVRVDDDDTPGAVA